MFLYIVSYDFHQCSAYTVNNRQLIADKNLKKNAPCVLLSRIAYYSHSMNDRKVESLTELGYLFSLRNFFAK